MFALKSVGLDLFSGTCMGKFWVNLETDLVFSGKKKFWVLSTKAANSYQLQAFCRRFNCQVGVNTTNWCNLMPSNLFQFTILNAKQSRSLFLTFLLFCLSVFNLWCALQIISHKWVHTCTCSTHGVSTCVCVQFNWWQNKTMLTQSQLTF